MDDPKSFMISTKAIWFTKNSRWRDLFVIWRNSHLIITEKIVIVNTLAELQKWMFVNKQHLDAIFEQSVS